MGCKHFLSGALLLIVMCFALPGVTQRHSSSDWHQLDFDNEVSWNCMTLVLVQGAMSGERVLSFLGLLRCQCPCTRSRAGLLCWELWLLWKMSSLQWQRAAGQNSLCHLRSLTLFVALPQNNKATGLDSTTEISSKYTWCNYFIPQFPGALIKVKITSRVKRDEVLFPRTLVNFAVSTQNHSFQITSFNHNMPCWHGLCTE